MNPTRTVCRDDAVGFLAALVTAAPQLVPRRWSCRRKH